MGNMGGMPSMGGQLGRGPLGMQGGGGPNLSLGMGQRSGGPQNFGFDPHTRGAPGAGLQGGGGGYQGGYDGPPSATFDPSDFPVLGRAGGQVCADTQMKKRVCECCVCCTWVCWQTD